MKCLDTEFIPLTKYHAAYAFESEINTQSLRGLNGTILMLVYLNL